MHKGFLITGAALAALSVILGAFGAHSLKQVVPAASLNTFETGVHYQFYHAIALLITGILFEKFPAGQLQWAGWCFIAGIILFSGSLYALTFLQAEGMEGFRKVGIITPFGGVAFILGWLFLLLGILKK